MIITCVPFPGSNQILSGAFILYRDAEHLFTPRRHPCHAALPLGDARKRMAGKAVTLLLAFAAALSQAAICYGVNGVEYSRQVICPGSSACCGEAATCMDNRLCHNAGDDQNTFVRGTCAENPYDKNKCAKICVYSAGLLSSRRVRELVTNTRSQMRRRSMRATSLA